MATIGKLTPDVESMIRKDVEELAKRFTKRSELSKETAALLFLRYHISPTANLVYTYTRKGSMTDVTKDVNEFWDEIRENSKIKLEVGDMPESLLNKAGELLGMMWQSAGQEANARLEVLRTEIKSELIKLQDESDKSTERAVIAVQELVDKKRQHEELNLMYQDVLQQLAVAHNEVKSLTEQLHACQATNKDLQLTVTNDRKSFAEELTIQRQQSASAEEHYKQQHAFILTQLDEARQNTRLAQEAVKKIEADKLNVEHQLRQQCNTLRDKSSELQGEVGELRGKLSSLTEERDRLLEQNAQMVSKLSTRSATKLSKSVK